MKLCISIIAILAVLPTQAKPIAGADPASWGSGNQPKLSEAKPVVLAQQQKGPLVIGGGNPAVKVIKMLAVLADKIGAEESAAETEYNNVVAFCTSFTPKVDFEIKTAMQEIEELKATIGEATATISSSTLKIDQLAGEIAKDEADLAAATKVRAGEAAEYAAEKKELDETIDLLSRAIVILQRELSKGSASMVQLPKVASITQALAILVQASVLDSKDGAKLSNLLQSFQKSEDENFVEEAGAPAAAVYESKSGNIVDTLEDLLEKARAQLGKADKVEANSRHNFETLKLSVGDEIDSTGKALAKTKSIVAEGQASLASAQSDLSMTQQELEEKKTTKETTEANCLAKANDREIEKASAAEELAVLAKAKEILMGAAGAAAKTYGLNQISFLQVYGSHLTSRIDLVNFELVRFLRDLAQKDGSRDLSLLASQISSAVRAGATTHQDPFAKIKGMITNMITKLESRQSAEATQKAYCDKEMGDTSAKKEARTSEVDALKVKMDQASAKYSKLQVQLTELTKEVAEISAAMAGMTKIRAVEKNAYSTDSAEVKVGIEVVTKGIAFLRDYYSASGRSAGPAGQIISTLEVVEADFKKGLVEMEAVEANAAKMYEKLMKQYKAATVSKEADIKYKTKESAGLKTSLAEITSDHGDTQKELDAVLEYEAKIKETCIIKVESWESKKAKRDAEIAGLKEALEILSSGDAFLQHRAKPMLLSSKSK